MGRRVNTRMVPTVLTLMILAGCGTREEDAADMPEDSAVTSSPDSTSGSDAESLVVGEGDAMQSIPLVLGRGGIPVEELEPQTYALLLVNRMERQAVVYAAAGAGRVVLDTIEPLDSARVDVEVRSREVTLQATDSTGRPLITDTIAPVLDSLTRWEVRRKGPDRL